jgi:glyoxylase-like metal-dependent hydrolase (beta-lactamase superfamily II)
MSEPKSWLSLEPDVYVFRDSCHVYAVRGRDGQWLVINAGTGLAVRCLAEFGAIHGLSVLLTHHFRDHTAGSPRFKEVGASVIAPYWDRDHLSGQQPAFRARETRLQYDMAWDNFAPIEPLNVDRWAMDYERMSLAGLTVEVVPAPGVTMGAVAYIVDLPSGRRVAFVGEMMNGPGILFRLSPLQHNYNDLIGGENILLSWERVLAAKPVVAYASHGPRLDDPVAAVAQLRGNLRRYGAIQPGYADRIDLLSAADGVERVFPRLFRSRQAFAETYFVLGASGRVLALDYGYDTAGLRLPQRPAFSTRRTLLHGAAAMAQHGGDGKIATVVATHYHDDHICGIPLLQRLFGTELWACENFADVLERPDHYGRPCLWTDPMSVNCRLAPGVRTHWEDVALTVHPMVGHTEFSSLLCLEFDGRRVAHIGDEFFFHDGKGVSAAPAASAGVFTNHVYRNGIALGGYSDCLNRLLAFKPDVILSGHAMPWFPDDGFWAKLERSATGFDTVHGALMNLGNDHVHFGPESQPARFEPYCLHIPDASQAKLSLGGWVLNPFNRETLVQLCFVTPREGWRAEPLTLRLASREKRRFETPLVVSSERVRRQPISVDLTADGQPFGQAAEAWVTVGHDTF